MNRINARLVVLSVVLSASQVLAQVSFSQSAREVEQYDFIELSVLDEGPADGNPFLDGSLEGMFTCGGGESLRVRGFCDSSHGSVYKIRYMPEKAGECSYTVRFRRGETDYEVSGRFVSRPSGRKGLIRVDPDHPFHFVWSGTKEHFFYSGTTTYWLLGWRDESIIERSLKRLAGLGINRIRVALNGRTKDGMRWKEPLVKPSEEFQFRLEPWPAENPDSVEDPGYDISRFNLAHFQKCERMLKYARELNIVVSLIFFLDGADNGVDPFGEEMMGGREEKAYYEYAIARFSAYSNVMWDVTNEWHLFRNEAWVEEMGRFIDQQDPFGHLISVHGKGNFPFRTADWCDYAIFQSWDEHGAYDFMLRNRQEQLDSGVIKPQVNEEYGYEDHYPHPWGDARKWPLRIAETRRKLAWEMAMAGGYQSTGERANLAGYGGWITGWGSDEMVMLRGYARMREFFESFPWWELEPMPELTQPGVRCLAQVGLRYVIYLPEGGSTIIQLEPGRYRARRYNPRKAEWASLGTISDSEWNTPVMPDTEDWVVLIDKAD